MWNLLQKRLQNMDEDEARRILDNIDEEQIHKAIKQMMDMYVAPHLYDIRDARRTEYHDPKEVRETYRKLPEERQEEVFHGTMQDLLTLASEIRERPQSGFMRLKSYLRDPTTTEALLLIFENEHIDPDYRGQLKDYTATQMFLIGTCLVPEMYGEDEVREALNIMNISTQRQQNILNDYRQSVQDGR